MKKIFASVFASLLMVFSFASQAAVVASTSASGSPGDTRTLDVSLASGDISFGGDFTIVFDSTRLTFLSIVGRRDNSYDFLATFSDPFTSGATFSLAYNGLPIPATGSIDSIFSITFRIKDPYPPSNFPDVTHVDISGFVYDNALSPNGPNEVSFEAIHPTITVDRPANRIPEPGMLGLVGLALVIMVGFDRRRRVHRG